MQGQPTNPMDQVTGSLPSMPTNPLTGEEYTTPSGQTANIL